MANHLINDQCEAVVAVGAPGSIERARCEWPALIQKIKSMQTEGKLSRNSASNLFNRRKIVLISDRVVILQASGFPEEQARSLGGAI